MDAGRSATNAVACSSARWRARIYLRVRDTYRGPARDKEIVRPREKTRHDRGGETRPAVSHPELSSCRFSVVYRRRATLFVSANPRSVRGRRENIKGYRVSLRRTLCMRETRSERKGERARGSDRSAGGLGRSERDGRDRPPAGSGRQSGGNVEGS